MFPQTERSDTDPRRGSSVCPTRPAAAEVLRFGQRYADLRDRHLADMLIVEDAAEEREELSPHERISCPAHRRWAHECISSPAHVISVTGHRWCRLCDAEASVAVDQLTGSVSVVCTRCHKTPDTAATRQILRTCRASLLASSGRAPALEQVPAA